MLIKAPREVVWQVVSELHHYQDWNSQLALLDGQVAEGQRVRLRLRPLWYRTFTFKPVIHRYEAPHSFGWKGMTMLPGILDGEYLFILKAEGTQTTRLIFHQRYTGQLAFLMPRLGLYRDVRKSCIKMNAEIKRRTEDVFSGSKQLSPA